MWWTIAVLGKPLVVEGSTVGRAKTKAIEEYNKVMGTDYPLTFLRMYCRVERHDDKRVTFNPQKQAKEVLQEASP